MKSFITRVCEWNNIRYDQVIDVNLAKRLLNEELSEALEALEELENIFTEDDRPKSEWIAEYRQRQAHLIKELFDICFVSIGVVWKTGLAAGDINEIFRLCCASNDSKPATKLPASAKGIKGDNFMPAEPEIIKLLEKRS